MPNNPKFSDGVRKVTELDSIFGSFNWENRPETYFTQFPNPNH